MQNAALDEAQDGIKIARRNINNLSYADDMISLQSKGLSRVFSNTTVQKASILWCSVFFTVQLSHPYMTTGKTIALTTDLCWQSNVSAFHYAI